MLDKFTIPKMYTEMDKLGWLETKDKNPDALWIHGMRWYSCEEIKGYKYEENEIKNYVPFARTGGGDMWVWHIESDELYVGLCYHDDYEGVFYAKNIEGAIFRKILEFVSDSMFFVDFNMAESYQMDITETRNHLKDWRYKFGKWFDKNWLMEIDELIKMDFKYCNTQDGDYYALLTPDEASEKVKKYIGFELIDKTFIWSK